MAQDTVRCQEGKCFCLCFNLDCQEYQTVSPAPIWSIFSMVEDVVDQRGSWPPQAKSNQRCGFWQSAALLIWMLEEMLLLGTNTGQGWPLPTGRRAAACAWAPCEEQLYLLYFVAFGCAAMLIWDMWNKTWFPDCFSLQFTLKSEILSLCCT